MKGGVAVTLASIGFGARIIERHLTLDKNMEGPDHAASLTPEEFRQLIKSIRDIELALGSSSDRILSQGELINRENLSKSIYLKTDIKKVLFLIKNTLNIKVQDRDYSQIIFIKL